MARARANRKAQSVGIKRRIDELRSYYGLYLIKGYNSKISREET